MASSKSLRWLWLPVLVTALTRAYGLADWPLSGDEGFTLRDSTVEFGWDNLRVLPFAFNHYLTVPALGATELALRVGSFIAAVLATGFVGWGLARLYSPAVGIGTAWAMTLSPALLVHGQFARYYMQSFLLASVVMVAFRLGLERRRWLGIAVLALVAGWFTVPSTVFIVPGLLLWARFNRALVWEALGRPSRRAVALVAGAVGLVAVVAGGYVLIRYPTGPAHGVRYFSFVRLPVQLVSLFGLSETLLVAGGLWVGWREPGDSPDRTFLPLVALGSSASLLAVYPFIGVAPAHFVSVAPPLFGLAGLLLARLWQTGSAGRIGVVVCLLAGVQQFGSHYTDGSRADFRVAAAHLATVAPGAPVVTTEALNLAYYARDRVVEPIALVDGQIHAGWAVVPERRLGVDGGADIEAALVRSCVLSLRHYRPRFDHRVNAVRVYRCGGNVP